MPLTITSGYLKGRVIKTSSGNHSRPTTELLRQAIFNKLQNDLEGCSFLDLFSGTGSMGIEALSRGASHATFVEAHLQTAKILHQNIETLQLQDKTSVFILDVCKALAVFERKQMSFDYVYIDPPYKDLKEEISSAKTLSFVLKTLDSTTLLKSGALVFVEFSSLNLKDKATATFLEMPLVSLKLTQEKKYGRSILYTFKKD